MKALKLKNVGLFILTVLFSLSCFFAVTSFQSKTVKAEEQPVIDNSVFEMEKGAQLALNKDGIRFVTKMGKDVYDQIVTNDVEDKVKLSVYVTISSELEKLTGDKLGKYEQLDKKVVIDINEELIYQNSGYYYANAVVTNLNKDNNSALTESQFDYQFVGIAIITDNSGESAEYKYASFSDNNVENNIRSQYGLLQSAMLDYENQDVVDRLLSSESPYLSWFGSEEYPMVIDTLEDYNSLVKQINEGNEITFTVEMSSAIDKSAGEQLDGANTLPENLKYYHYVSFYNGETKLGNTVKVYDKAGVEYAGETPAKDGDGFFTFDFANAWTDKDGEIVDLDKIEKTQNVYAKFEKVSPRTGANVNTVFFFGDEKGLSQVSGGRNISNSNISIDTQKDSNGMLKISVDTTSASKKYIELHYNVKDYAFNDGDIVTFEVYVDLSESVEFIELYWGYTHRARLANKEWGTVVVASSHLNKTSTGTTAVSDDQIRIYAYTDTTVYGSQGEAGATGINGNIYFGKAKAVSSNEVINIYESGVEYTFGSQNIEYVSGTSQNLANTMGCTLGNWTPNDGAFNQYGDKKPQIIDGTMRFYMQGSIQQTPILALIPKKAMKLGSNAKMHVTIRGNVDCLWFWGYYYSSSSGAYKAGGREGNSTSTAEKLDNGYTRYTLNYNSGWAGTTFEEFFIFLNNNQSFSKPNYKLCSIADITFEDVTWVDKA